MLSDKPRKRRLSTQTAMMLATLAGMGMGINLGSHTPKPPKDKPLEFTPEENEKLDLLHSDRSSQGRKAYKAYHAELIAKYTKSV